MNLDESEKVKQIFSLLIYKAKIGLTEKERNILIKEVYDQNSKSKNPSFKKKESAWTGDTQGFEFLYSNKKFEKLFDLISLKVKKYTEIIGLNNDKLDCYYQRAWATITKNKERIALHKHQQSHITFAYYLKKNKNDGTLNFWNEAAQNDLIPGLFKNVHLIKKNIFKTNIHNANFINFWPEVDEIYIFPSKSWHSTSQNETTEERISISADISLVAKDSGNMEFTLTPINKWTKF